MALEGIPLAVEALGILSAALGTGATAAWTISHLLHKHGKDKLERELTASVNLSTSYADENDRQARQIDRLNEQVKELREQVASLDQDLKAHANPDAARTIEELRYQLARLDELRASITADDQSLWQLRQAQPPADFAARMANSKTQVVTVINYKGGVGKTTIVTGLAAYLANRGKRVLVIDFDYQGSLTRTLVLGSRIPLGSFIKADRVIGGKINGRELTELGHDLGATLRGTRLITSGQTFDGFEFRMMLNWLLGESPDDVRYRLAQLVLSDEVQSEFDYVLVDAPPRASTGAINAICASHALIVPTVLDSLSVDAAASFLARTNASFRSLNPALSSVGIVATLTEGSRLTAPEQAAMKEAKKALTNWPGSRIFNARLRHFRALTQAAGNDIAYLKDRGVRQAFDALGDELLKVLNENKAGFGDARSPRAGVRNQRLDGPGGVAAQV
jgi:chromosome partitioning protein